MSDRELNPLLHTRAQRRPRGGVLHILTWVTQIGLGLVIAGGGALKLTADPAMVEMFDDVGAGQWLRIVVGVCEIAGGVGLLVPRLRALAALGLSVLLLGAVVTNIAILNASAVLPLILTVLAFAILWVRHSELPLIGTLTR